MKIFNESKTPGLISEKNETQGRVSKKPVSDKSAPVVLKADELELTNKKTPVGSMREVEIANAAAVEFDISDVPAIKLKLASLNNYLLNNPAAALSAQANLNTDVVAGLIG